MLLHESSMQYKLYRSHARGNFYFCKSRPPIMIAEARIDRRVHPRIERAAKDRDASRWRRPSPPSPSRRRRCRRTPTGKGRRERLVNPIDRHQNVERLRRRHLPRKRQSRKHCAFHLQFISFHRSSGSVNTCQSRPLRNPAFSHTVFCRGDQVHTSIRRRSGRKR